MCTIKLDIMKSLVFLLIILGFSLLFGCKSYKEEFIKFRPYKNKDFIMENFSDEYLEDYSNVMAWKFNSDMKKYLHNPDHRICGNFNNIDYDYPYHIYGEVTYDTPLVNAMVARLDAGEDSEQANEDRDFLVDWFFETFGTWGISYNFQSNISEFLYMEFKNQQS